MTAEYKNGMHLTLKHDGFQFIISMTVTRRVVFEEEETCS